ncbi:ABC transporter permease [Actinokineospora bangkokensis]|uniref:Transport permease protein n=1 Tax=Actinokineospora bangkokensis TaxID=1193682 RepID=A0A1Q9LTI5_9PSEU|nr:ABC transporter permease [Actinokineospora bangkokensis]OLR95345.1 ABC transporter permease [Actinokineospora bangkokensis]
MTATTAGTTARPLPGPLRSALLVVEGNWTWYRRNWRSTIISTLLQPVLFLVALGIGFGSQVQPGEATLGLPYVEYLAPALLAATLMQTAVGESTYPVLSGFKWQRVYWAIISTPIGAAQVLYGQLAWLAARLLFTALAFTAVAAALGAVAGPAILVAVPFALLTGMACAAPVIAYAATIESEGQQFNVVFRFVVMPMMLFSGTFFPVEQLPGWVQPLVWVSPVWHGTELCRGVALGGLDPLPALGHTAFLLVLLVVGAVWARRNFVRRLEV